MQLRLYIVIMLSVYLCGVFVSASAMTVDVKDSYNSLLGDTVFSHVLFRHGHRMPLEFYPNDPHKDSPHWPFRKGQLTDDGKRQAYELGRWLRRRYNHLLSEHFDVSEIFIQSTDLDRTLMTAQCCMAGLYRPHLSDNWDPQVAWEPTPIHTIPIQHDYLLGASTTCQCPAFDAETLRVSALPEVQALLRKFQYLYDYLSEHTGTTVREFGGAIKVYDTLAIEDQYNMTLPAWAHAIYPEPIKEAGLYSFALPVWTPLLQRLRVGSLLKEMVHHFQEKRAGTLYPDRKLWVYSAHDSTLSALLGTFNVFDIHFPPYTSCLVLELRVIKEEYFVTLFYRNSTVAEPVLLPIKTCSTLCPLDQFVSLMQPLLPHVWEEECKLPQNTIKKYYWMAAIAVIGVVIYTITLVLTIKCFKKKSPKTYFATTSPFIKVGSKTFSNCMPPLPK